MSTMRHLIEALRGGGTSVYKNGKLVKQTYGPSTKTEKSKPLREGKVLNVNERRMLEET